MLWRLDRAQEWSQSQGRRDQNPRMEISSWWKLVSFKISIWIKQSRKNISNIIAGFYILVTIGMFFSANRWMNLRVQRPWKDQTTYQALSPLRNLEFQHLRLTESVSTFKMGNCWSRPVVMQSSSTSSNNTLYVLPLFTEQLCRTQDLPSLGC